MNVWTKFHAKVKIVVAPDEKVSRLPPLGIMSVCAKFYCNPSVVVTDISWQALLETNIMSLSYMVKLQIVIQTQTPADFTEVKK